MRRKYLVKWIEEHETEVEAYSHDDAWDQVEVGYAGTFKGCQHEQTIDIGPADDDGPDPMSESHNQKENES